MNHPLSPSGALAHHYRFGGEIIVDDDPLSDAYYLGTCIVNGCGTVKQCPVFVETEYHRTWRKKRLALEEELPI